MAGRTRPRPRRTDPRLALSGLTGQHGSEHLMALAPRQPPPAHAQAWSDTIPASHLDLSGSAGRGGRGDQGAQRRERVPPPLVVRMHGVQDLAMREERHDRAPPQSECLPSRPAAPAFGVNADVRTRQGGAALTEAALDLHGRIDIDVNNAGTMRSAYFADSSVADIELVLGVHLAGAFHVTRPTWRAMQSRGYGRVVMTSSGAMFGQQGVGAYAAAKGGIIGLWRALAAEGEDLGIKVHCVMPYARSLIAIDNPVVGADMALIRQSLDQLRAERDPRSVAALVTYLCSERCRVSGNAYSALAGRYAQLVLALTDGWLAQDVAAVTAEQIELHLDEIEAADVMSNPRSITDEITHVLARRGAAPG